MKYQLKLVLPVLFVSMAVGFILYGDLSFVDETRDVSGQSASSEQYGVPHDIVYTKVVKSVVFSHQTHAVDHGFECKVCHEDIFKMKANSVESQSDFNMKGLAEGKYCGSCHSSSTQVAFSSATQCARCHLGVKGLKREEQANIINTFVGGTLTGATALTSNAGETVR